MGAKERKGEGKTEGWGRRWEHLRIECFSTLEKCQLLISASRRRQRKWL